MKVNNTDIYLLKGINLRIEADSVAEDLQLVSEDNIGQIDKVFNKKVNTAIKKVLMNRIKGSRGSTIDINGKIKDMQSKQEKYKEYKEYKEYKNKWPFKISNL